MIYTTFRALHDECACEARYRHLAKALGGIRKYGRDTPISALQILEHNGLDDLVWAWELLRPQEDADRIGRLFACDCADTVRHLMPDERSRNAIDVARRYAVGEASREELDAAAAAAIQAAAEATTDAAANIAPWTTENTTPMWFLPFLLPRMVIFGASFNHPFMNDVSLKVKIMRKLLEEEEGDAHGRR